MNKNHLALLSTCLQWHLSLFYYHGSLIFERTVHIDLWTRNRREIEMLQWTLLGFGGSPSAAAVHTHIQSHSIIFLPYCFSPHNLLPHLWASLTLSAMLLIISLSYCWVILLSFARPLHPKCYITKYQCVTIHVIYTPEYSSYRRILGIQVTTQSHNVLTAKMAKLLLND